jgi:FkbM family methyltransferase
MTTVHDALALVLNAIESGDIATANAIAGQLLPQVPRQPDLLHLLATIADRNGKPVEAMAWRRLAIASRACLRAAALQAQGAIAEARTLYEEALKVDTYNLDACNALGALNQRSSPPDPDSARYGRPPLNFYETKLGRYSLPSDAPNDVIMLRMKAGQLFEAEIVDALRPYVRQSSVVIDVGANFGQMSLTFSAMVGKDGQVYSIEADDYIYYVLRTNLKNNGAENVTSIFAAAYDSNGASLRYPRQDFKEHGAYGSYGIDPNAQEGREVLTMTIDSLKIERPVSVIKVDIQGSDLFALRGARDTIAQHKPAIIFEFEQQFQEKFSTSFNDYVEFIGSIGYRVEKTVNAINYLIVPA